MKNSPGYLGQYRLTEKICLSVKITQHRNNNTMSIKDYLLDNTFYKT